MTYAELEPRVRRRVDQVLLDGEGDDATLLKSEDIHRHIAHAAQAVVARLRTRADLFPSLQREGAASTASGALAVLGVRLPSRAMERRSFRGMMRRPSPGYVLADGALRVNTAKVPTVRTLVAPSTTGEIRLVTIPVPDALLGVVVEEAAAACLLVMGGNAPEAWGASDAQLQPHLDGGRP